MIERQLFADMGGFDESFPHPFLEDVDFRIRLQQRNIPFQFVAEAVVVHPQRLMGSIMKVLSQYEAYFYLSRKYHKPPSAFGFSAYHYLQGRRSFLAHSDSFFDFSAMICRTIVEALILLFLTPVWMVKYAGTKK